jgi:hypothetical protein
LDQIGKADWGAIAADGLAVELVLEVEELRAVSDARDDLAQARDQRHGGRGLAGRVQHRLRRIGLGRLDNLEPKPPVQRYEYDTPGGMIHIDMKKLGRIDGIGHRITGSRNGKSRTRGIGWEVLHVAIDDASRLAYTEVLPDEKKETACAFTARAIDWFADKRAQLGIGLYQNGIRGHVERPAEHVCCGNVVITKHCTQVCACCSP